METKFKELYYLSGNDENAEQDLDKENDFVFCGRNWGYYYTSKVNEFCEKIENVELVKGIFKKTDPQWIDYDEELDLNLIYSK